MNGDQTCPSNKPYHDIGSGFNGSCSPGWRRPWGPLGERYERLVRVVKLVRVEGSLPYSGGGQLPVDVSVGARQSGGDPAGEADRESGRQPLRPDGQLL